MLDCLPINESGEALRIELLNQFNTIQEKGLSYVLNGVMVTENHFNLNPLKVALQTYIDGFPNWNWTKREDHWCTKVGQAQLPLPVHIRQHYCDPEESFYPNTPTFNKEHFKRSLKFCNWTKDGIDESWDSVLVGLGVDFAICGGGHRGWGGHAGRVAGGARARADLAAIAALEKMRTETDLGLLKQRLESPLQKPEMISESSWVIS